MSMTVEVSYIYSEYLEYKWKRVYSSSTYCEIHKIKRDDEIIDRLLNLYQRNIYKLYKSDLTLH